MVVKKNSLCIIVLCLLLMACSKPIEVQIQEQLDLGNKYLTEMNYEQAVIAFTKAIELDEKNIAAYEGLGTIYVNQGKYDEAMKAFNTVKELDETSWVAYEGTARVYQAQGKTDEAISMVEQGLDKCENVSEEGKQFLTGLYFTKIEPVDEAVNFDEDIRYCNQILTVDPDNKEIMALLEEFTELQKGSIIPADVEEACPYQYECLITDEAAVALLNPYEEYLVKYLNTYANRYDNADFELQCQIKIAYLRLADCYLRLGLLDKALEIRVLGFDKTGALELNPEGYENELSGRHQSFDKYGRFISNERNDEGTDYYYYDGAKVSEIIKESDDGTESKKYEYSSDGRCSRTTSVYTGTNGIESSEIEERTYGEGYFISQVTRQDNIYGGPKTQKGKYLIDEYGRWKGFDGFVDR